MIVSTLELVINETPGVNVENPAKMAPKCICVLLEIGVERRLSP